MKILFLFLVLICCGQAQAGWFGPSNAEDCIKEHADEVHSAAAGQKLDDVCRQQFPVRTNETKAAYINPDFILAQQDVNGKWWRRIKDTWYLYANGWKARTNLTGQNVPVFSNDPNKQQQILEYFGVQSEAAPVALSSPRFGVESIEAQLRQTADEARKSLPMMVSENVQGTNITAVGKTLMYRYNFTSKKSVLANLKVLKAEYFGNSVNAVCTNPDMLKALKNGVSLDYQYYDSNNEFVMQYTVDASTCR